ERDARLRPAETSTEEDTMRTPRRPPIRALTGPEKLEFLRHTDPRALEAAHALLDVAITRLDPDGWKQAGFLDALSRVARNQETGAPAAARAESDWQRWSFTRAFTQRCARLRAARKDGTR